MCFEVLALCYMHKLSLFYIVSILIRSSRPIWGKNQNVNNQQAIFLTNIFTSAEDVNILPNVLLLLK